MPIPESDATFAQADARKAAWVFSDKVMRYVVPDYQRRFVWGPDEVRRFIKAILPVPDWYAEDKIGDVPPRFLGSLVFWSDGSVRNVIDGQQRLTTLSLAFAVLRDLLTEANEVALAANAEHALYAGGDLDPDDKEIRLRSLQEDADVYAQLLRHGFDSLGDAQTTRIAVAYAAVREFFGEAIDAAKADGCSRSEKELLKRIYHRCMYGTEFVMLVARNETDAFSLFDSLNTPGVPLDTGDRLKNKLLSLSDRHGKADVYEKVRVVWREIEEILEPEWPTDFLHAYWRAFHNYVPSKHLYNAIVHFIEKDDSPAQILTIVKRFRESAKLFARSYSESQQASMSPKIRIPYRVQSDIKARTARPLLLWVETNAKPQLQAVLRVTEVIAARQIYCGMTAQPFNNKYNVTLASLAENPKQDIPKLLVKLFTDIVPNDRIFAERLQSQDCYGTSGKVQWLLRRINDSFGTTEHDLSKEEVHIEHILAKKAQAPAKEEAGVSDLDDEEFESLVGSLGNVTLLFEKINRSLQNKPVSEKWPKYEECDLKITKDLLESYEHFDKHAIEKRTRALAKRAVDFWAWPPTKH